MEQARLALDGYGSGVFIQPINIEALSTAGRVADAFSDVASARADRDGSTGSRLRERPRRESTRRSRKMMSRR
jgi:hypothetical protein